MGIPGTILDELVCHVRILRSQDRFVARVRTEAGGERELRSYEGEDLIAQLVQDLQEEFDLSW